MKQDSSLTQRLTEEQEWMSRLKKYNRESVFLAIKNLLKAVSENGGM